MTQPGTDADLADKKREKRTITEIRESKRTGEKMVYMSVPDYTSAKWAEMAGVDVAVVGDSLAMIAHGHPSTVPATMDMMGLHALSELSHRRACAHECDALHARGGERCRQTAGRQEPGPYSEGARRRRDSHRVPHRADTAYHRHVRRFQDSRPHGRGGHENSRGCARYRGCRLLHVGIRGRAGQNRQTDLRATDHSHHRHRRRCRHRWPNFALSRFARRLHRL